MAATPEPSTDPVQKKRHGGGNPQWKKGVSGNPKGRGRGAKDALSRRIFEEIKNGNLETPLKFALGILTSTDPNVTMKDRQWAATAALPYCHKKMPIAIEGGDNPIRIFDAAKLGSLTADELKAFLALLTKLGIG